MPTVLFHTLGCRLNMAETALAADDLHRHGYQILEKESQETKPDLIVINSCAVTGMASRKSRQTVRAMRRKYPQTPLVLMGCDAKIDRDIWEADPAAPDLVLPHPVNHPLSSYLSRLSRIPRSRFIPEGFAEEGFREEGAARFSERTRANLKVQDGCDFCCTYCAIPTARGPARSRSLKDILRETGELADAGYREIVLCGVNISMYRQDGQDLAGLLEMLATRYPALRFRLGSAEPGEVIPKIVDCMLRHPNICRFLHLPLQHGSSTILQAMGRLYSPGEYAEMVTCAAAKIPDICIGADVIVGFPGETDALFADGTALLKQLPLSLLHVFPFSPRPGTIAAKLPGRPSSSLVDCRVRTLLQLAEEKATSFAKSQIGKTAEIILEETAPASGWTDHYLHVTLPDFKHGERNQRLSVRITAADGNREVMGIALSPMPQTTARETH